FQILRSQKAKTNMHEISLIRSVFNTLEAEFDAEELTQLSAIEMKVGLLSNVEPILMQNALKAVTEAENRFRGVQLKIEVIPIDIYCKACGVHSRIENYKFVCQSCGIPNNNVVKGKELLIHKVHFDKPVPASDY
ncbi:MAG: hydrogenase maturation nickel metallochaperone HypA, partial [Bacteroidota bacterium]